MYPPTKTLNTRSASDLSNGIYAIDWVEVLQPHQLIRVMSSQSVYLTTLFLGRLSPLRGWPVLCMFFRQKLTTALLESVEGKEWPLKIFQDLYKRMLPDLAGIEPSTSWSPVGCASDWVTEAESVYMMFLCAFFSDFLYESICSGYSFKSY